MTATAVAALVPARQLAAGAGLVLRSATAPDTASIQALIARYQAAGRLLPRTEEDIRRHAGRFLVIEDAGDVVGCAELAPLSAAVAEVRSLVLDERLRGLGLGRVLVEALTGEARLAGFRSVCAFTHEPGYFARLGFSLVPHAWLPEKIGTDCAGCALFRRCGQAAMRLALDEVARRGAAA